MIAKHLYLIDISCVFKTILFIAMLLKISLFYKFCTNYKKNYLIESLSLLRLLFSLIEGLKMNTKVCSYHHPKLLGHIQYGCNWHVLLRKHPIILDNHTYQQDSSQVYLS